MSPLLTVRDAHARVIAAFDRLPAEMVSVADAAGRVLAVSPEARLTQPPADLSAMDGYAVRAEDVPAAPTTLTLVGQAPAGGSYDHALKPGETVRIFTGAPVPQGADTIVIQEETEQTHGLVTVKKVDLHAHIRPRGQDFKEGETLLTGGIRLGPCELMLAAAMNHAEVPVRRKPKVAILATGDEVVPVGSELGKDQIVSSVPIGLATLIEKAGGQAMPLGIAKDDPKSLVTLARSGSAADILVTIGGASVGERDLVASALKSEGLEIDFWKIAMRPGKPLLYGRLGHQRVLSLPGNPVSALITAHVFLVPMLKAMLGLTTGALPLPEAVLGEALAANGPREHYMRARSDWREDGTRVVRPLPSQDSSLVAELARADCLIVRAPYAPSLAAGRRVGIIPFDRD